ncbi:hypothetical protein ASF36_09975 [Methylobacterium sp. Leaf90]|jgi:hypothetical protein|nr:hypothetical protein ASF36_09975 [Methylobacterium sp. Leaf90]
MRADADSGSGHLPQHRVEGAAACAGIRRDRVHPDQRGIHRHELDLQQVGLPLHPNGRLTGDPVPSQGDEQCREPAGLGRASARLGIAPSDDRDLEGRAACGRRDFAPRRSLSSDRST